MSFFSLLSETDQADDTLGSLFTNSVKRDAPNYDYSEVDAKKKRKNKALQADIDEDPNKDVDSEAEEKAEQEAAKIVKLYTDRMAQVKREDSKKRIIDEETDKRTVFVGNLSVNTKKPHLEKLFKKFGKIEAIWFRCAARPDMKTTKKVAGI